MEGHKDGRTDSGRIDEAVGTVCRVVCGGNLLHRVVLLAGHAQPFPNKESGGGVIGGRLCTGKCGSERTERTERTERNRAAFVKMGGRHTIGSSPRQMPKPSV